MVAIDQPHLIVERGYRAHISIRQTYRLATCDLDHGNRVGLHHHEPPSRAIEAQVRPRQ